MPLLVLNRVRRGYKHQLSGMPGLRNPNNTLISPVHCVESMILKRGEVRTRSRSTTHKCAETIASYVHHHKNNTTTGLQIKRIPPRASTFPHHHSPTSLYPGYCPPQAQNSQAQNSPPGCLSFQAQWLFAKHAVTKLREQCTLFNHARDIKRKDVLLVLG